MCGACLCGFTSPAELLRTCLIMAEISYARKNFLLNIMKAEPFLVL